MAKAAVKAKEEKTDVDVEIDSLHLNLDVGIDEILKNLPERPKRGAGANSGLREVVVQHYDSIKQAREKGYAPAIIAALFKRKGIDIKPTTLMQIFNKIAIEKGDRKKMVRAPRQK